MNICVVVLFCFFFFLFVCYGFVLIFEIVLVWFVEVLFLCELVSVDRFMYYHVLVSLRQSVARFMIFVSYPFCLNLIRVDLL